MRKLGIVGVALVFALFLGGVGAKEGKKNPEIDLPIVQPEPIEGEPWFPPIEEESVVFVIDSSCSMAGSRIAKAKEELIKAIQALATNIRFSFVFYSCNITVWRNKLVEATEANKRAAIQAVQRLTAQGATATSTAVMKALALDRKNTYVVLLTDGAPNCTNPTGGWVPIEEHLSRILGANTQKAQIDVYAIQPYAASYRQFCKDIAARTGGKYKEVQ